MYMNYDSGVKSLRLRERIQDRKCSRERPGGRTQRTRKFGSDTKSVASDGSLVLGQPDQRSRRKWHRPELNRAGGRDEAEYAHRECPLLKKDISNTRSVRHIIERASDQRTEPGCRQQSNCGFCDFISHPSSQ